MERDGEIGVTDRARGRDWDTEREIERERKSEEQRGTTRVRGIEREG